MTISFFNSRSYYNQSNANSLIKHMLSIFFPFLLLINCTPSIYTHIENRDYNKVKAWLDTKPDVNASNFWDQTPMQAAVSNSDTQMVTLLYNHGANIQRATFGIYTFVAWEQLYAAIAVAKNPFDSTMIEKLIALGHPKCPQLLLLANRSCFRYLLNMGFSANTPLCVNNIRDTIFFSNLLDGCIFYNNIDAFFAIANDNVALPSSFLDSALIPLLLCGRTSFATDSIGKIRLSNVNHFFVQMEVPMDNDRADKELKSTDSALTCISQQLSEHYSVFVKNNIDKYKNYLSHDNCEKTLKLLSLMNISINNILLRDSKVIGSQIMIPEDIIKNDYPNPPFRSVSLLENTVYGFTKEYSYLLMLSIQIDNLTASIITLYPDLSSKISNGNFLNSMKQSLEFFGQTLRARQLSAKRF